MLVRTDELTGDALCFAVAKLNGYHYFPNGAALYVHRDTGERHRSGGYRPDINWAQAGPIIEREKINLSDWASTWYAKIHRNLSSGSGDTALIAAMRCFVASKLGQVVEVPDELTS